MLIKDHHGDWGLCTAVWLGMSRGVPGIPPKRRGERGTKGIPGKPGYFKMVFHNFR